MAIGRSDPRLKAADLCVIDIVKAWLMAGR
jgi:hypothetical protein